MVYKKKIKRILSLKKQTLTDTKQVNSQIPEKRIQTTSNIRKHRRGTVRGEGNGKRKGDLRFGWVSERDFQGTFSVKASHPPYD